MWWGLHLRPEGEDVSVRIPAYFSHSYRHQDRVVNEFFWNLLWATGLTLTVDPESESLSIPYLEYMMKRSAAFVAVVTRRPEQETYQCSPFMVFEYGLAVRAQKPRLVFVESGVSKELFGSGDEVLYFTRQALDQIEPTAQARLSSLLLRSDPATSILGHGLGKVGVLFGDVPTSEQSKRLHALIRRFGYTPISLDTQITDWFRLSLQLDELDFIVIDQNSSRLPPWLMPFINGRFVPSILIRNRAAGGTQPAHTPTSETDELLASVARADDLYVHYETTAELESRLSFHLERLRTEQTLFTEHDQGSRYFRSLGRRRERVFLSNASDANECGRSLSAALNAENVPHFHYLYQTDIELARLWADELPERVRSSQYFVMLITEKYWSSKYCLNEYQLAQELAAEGKLKIIPYFLAHSTADIPQQGRDLSELFPTEQARVIALDLDRMQTAEEDARS
ncbi:hypothetical protein GCM10009789_34260 [Kribbella sancticallisti]|uniref:TIR domain-containing protein n=1 Tax=Kribbella sancticallisti TaxID=460087 RepID=A0ABP4PEG7_9ACTN